jgi:hypothetical protein
MHLEYIRLKERVVHAAGKPNVVIGEHVGIELDVLADLSAISVLEPRLE